MKWNETCSTKTTFWVRWIEEKLSELNSRMNQEKRENRKMEAAATWGKIESVVLWVWVMKFVSLSEWERRCFKVRREEKRSCMKRRREEERRGDDLWWCLWACECGEKCRWEMELLDAVKFFFLHHHHFLTPRIYPLVLFAFHVSPNFCNDLQPLVFHTRITFSAAADVSVSATIVFVSLFVSLVICDRCCLFIFSFFFKQVLSVMCTDLFYLSIYLSIHQPIDLPI